MSALRTEDSIMHKLAVTFVEPTVSLEVCETPKSSKIKSKSSEKKSSPIKTSQQLQCFASGRFSESPSAHAIPPPPVSWFTQKIESDQSGSDSEVSSSCSSTESSLSSESGFGTGFQRVNPLQLISAVISA